MIYINLEQEVISIRDSIQINDKMLDFRIVFELKNGYCWVRHAAVFTNCDDERKREKMDLKIMKKEKPL